MKITKVDIGCFLLVVAFVVAVGLVLNAHRDEIFLEYRLKNREQFKEDLRILGIDVIDGIVDSPSVVIVLDEKEEFLQKISDLNATTVYFDHGFAYSVTFWVFEENMLVAYKFNYSGRE